MQPERFRALVSVEGVVQGVGFRPFVYRSAVSLGLVGHVRNVGPAVAIDVEGPEDAIARFVERLRVEAPPLARVARVVRESAPLLGRLRFEIAGSAPGSGPAPLAPDAAPCAACRGELRDPRDRRFAYPFLACTDCGPRFTIARSLPYDRERTTLDRFPLCVACRAEYEDPRDRRFHAESIGCPRCGPRLVLEPPGSAGDALAGARAVVRGGGILALKGVGGYQLCCDATDPRAVAAVRAWKHRGDKPLAVMVRDTEAARRLVFLPPGAASTLEGPERPIVLLPRRPDADIAPSVAPGLPDLGLMLPSSPLHETLLEDGPWVVTSGNRRDEPLVKDDLGAHERLGEVACAFLAHDRAIHARADDSVVQLHRGRPRVLRRARGYVPRGTPLPRPGPDLVAMGGDLKAAITVVRDGQAFTSAHLGDLGSIEVEAALQEALAHLVQLLGAKPRAVACDRHPDYASARIAREMGLPVVPVQHHHAHAAACLAEHGRAGPTLVAALDGSGWGDDGTVWGGELLLADLETSRRLGRLRPVRLAGGDAAAREPWRSAVSYLVDAGLEDALPALTVDPALRDAVARLATRAPLSPLASSAGRLFDAVSALAGVRSERGYEGQAAIQLEAAAREGRGEPYPSALTIPGDDDGLLELDTRPLVRAVVDSVRRGAPASEIGHRFHAGLARALVAALAVARDRTGVSTVCLVGGCFQNSLLLAMTEDGLGGCGMEALVSRDYPSGDGGLSLGQAAVASALLAATPDEGASASRVPEDRSEASDSTRLHAPREARRA